MSVSCPLCSGAVFSTWHFGLVTCESCGLVVATAVWRPAANERLNAEFFDDEDEPVASFWTRLFERMNNRRTLRRLSDAGSTARGKLLEVGVGNGSLLTAARTQGYNSSGCDLNHLLEHVADPVALLIAARRRLRPGGLLHLAVPNVSSWEAQLPGWNSYEPYHLLYFAPDTLQIAAQKAGFDILSVGTHESFSGWFLALFRTFRSQRPSRRARLSVRHPKRTSPGIEALYRIGMISVGALTLPLRRLQATLGRGDEVILLCRQPLNE
jgi:hypothetical protein